MPCGPDAAGITLGAGTHVVETAIGHTRRAPARRRPAPDGTSTSSSSTRPRRRRRPRRVPDGRRDALAAGHAARPAPPSRSTASHIDTQTATVTGATAALRVRARREHQQGLAGHGAPGPRSPAGVHAVDLGHLELIDGFANGWQVTAADLAALGGSNFTVAMTWTPQRLVWGALAVSGATLALCLVLGFLPTRSRRWLRRAAASSASGSGGTGRTGAPVDAVRPADADDAVRRRRSAVRRSPGRSPAAGLPAPDTPLTDAPCRAAR